MHPASAVYLSFILLLSCPVHIIGLWWAVGSPLVMDHNNICRKSRRMGSARQRQICRSEPDVVEQAAHGVKLALDECQYQFRNRRWNCTLIRKSFSRILKKDSRETGFVYAVTAAGVLYSLTHACSTGQSMHCSCDPNYRDRITDGKWEWGGCSDNVIFGYKKSRDLLDVRKRRKLRQKRSDIRSLVHIHNNEAGRLSVRNHMKRVCKCHGLSGSCNLQTCWWKMPRMRDVSYHLKEKFDGASMVTGSNDGNELLPYGTSTPPGREDIVYTEESPNFCEANRKSGSLGTRGRYCAPNSLGVDGCDLMCCGRGYVTSNIAHLENCRCRLLWCCEVVCQACNVTNTIHYCR